MTRPICSVSIDVDPLACYYRIHALGEPPAALGDVIMRRCVPRYAALFAELGLRATFFIVGRDLDIAELGPSARAARAQIVRLRAAGHEIGNHSHGHPYDLARFARAAVAAEIGRAHDVVEDTTGAPPRGFRAPGYDVSPNVLEALIELGYLYDSSLLPSPPYYAAKAGVMAAMRLAGRPSGAVLTDPRALLAPCDPFRPDAAAPWRRGAAPLVELPIAVTPVSRAPAIGTSLLLAPGWLRKRLIRAMRRRPLFNFELHGIDLIDAELDGIPGELVARQPDLRAPMARKRDALANALAEIGRHFRFATLVEAADEMAPLV